jgi:hypothetical protein
MHFSFNLFRTTGLYVFRALLAHPQGVLHKRHLLCCVRVMSIGCGTVVVKLQPCHSQLTLYARSIPNAVCIAPPEDEQVMLETCRSLWLSIDWMKSASGWVSVYWYTMMHGQKNIKFTRLYLCNTRIQCTPFVKTPSFMCICDLVSVTTPFVGYPRNSVKTIFFAKRCTAGVSFVEVVDISFICYLKA